MKRFKNEVVYKILSNDNINDIKNYLKDLRYKLAFSQDKGNYLYTYEDGCFQFLDGYLKDGKIEARSLEEFYALAAMSNEEKGIKGEWWYYNKEYKGFEGRFTVNKIYQQVEPLINNLCALIDDNRKENGYAGLNLKFFRKATVEEIQAHFDKTNDTKKLIGYKIKPEFKIPYYQIFTDIQDLSNNITFEKNSPFYEKMKDLKVLDLWFYSVYEEEFKVGDWVYIIKAQNGAKGAETKIGMITKDKSSYGLITNSYEKINIRISDRIWTVAENWNKVELRKATKEEIESVTEIKFNDYIAQFKNDNVIFGNVSFSKKELKTLFDLLSFPGYNAILYVNNKEVSVSFLEKILNHFQN